jgi:hypothetical protein
MFGLFKSSEEKIKTFLEEFSLNDLKAFSIIINESEFTAQWEIAEKKCAIHNNLKESTITNTENRTFKTKEFSNEIKELVTKTLLLQFEKAKQEIHKFPNIEQASDGELKGQEWIEVTNRVLKESYKKAKQADDLLVQGNIYIGYLENDHVFSIRFISYNLDYKVDFLENGKIFVNVYDDKNQERGSAKKSSYSGEFYNNRPVILDNILGLCAEMIKASKVDLFR